MKYMKDYFDSTQYVTIVKKKEPLNHPKKNSKHF